MSRHHLKASAETCHWGFFDAARKPVLAIDSGDRVTVDTLTGAPEVVPTSGFHVPPELTEVHARAERFTGGSHILTGPIAIRGAKPGQVLEVRIHDVKLRQDWGFNVIRPLAGTLQDDFHETRLIHIPLDQKRNVGRLPWGLELPLAPFFGIMGVAPPKAWGRITSIVPRAHGGNIDNKELVAGNHQGRHAAGVALDRGSGSGERMTTWSSPVTAASGSAATIGEGLADPASRPRATSESATPCVAERPTARLSASVDVWTGRPRRSSRRRALSMCVVAKASPQRPSAADAGVASSTRRTLASRNEAGATPLPRSARRPSSSSQLATVFSSECTATVT